MAWFSRFESASGLGFIKASFDVVAHLFIGLDGVKVADIAGRTAPSRNPGTQLRRLVAHMALGFLAQKIAFSMSSLAEGIALAASLNF